MTITRHLPFFCTAASILGFLSAWWAPPGWWWIDAVLVGLLVAALLAVAKGDYPLFQSRKMEGPLDQIIYMIPVIIVLRALSTGVYTENTPMLPALPIGLGYAYCCYLARRYGAASFPSMKHLSLLGWIGLTVAGTALGIGLLIDANELITRSSLTVLGKVVDKNIRRTGRQFIADSYFEIESTKSAAASGSYRVSQAMYNSTQVGQTVCVEIDSGLLGYQWKSVHHC